MGTIKLTAHVDKNGRLTATVPEGVPPGPIDILVLVPAEEDDAGRDWAEGIAREWEADWSDPREDIYTLEDGEPLNPS